MCGGLSGLATRLAHFKSKEFGAAQEKYSKALRVLNKVEAAAAPQPRSPEAQCSRWIIHQWAQAGRLASAKAM